MNWIILDEIIKPQDFKYLEVFVFYIDKFWLIKLLSIVEYNSYLYLKKA